MNNRLLWTGFASGIVFTLVVGLAVVGFSGGGSVEAALQRGQGRGADAGPPPPCGPAGDLDAALAENVAADSRCFELRAYTVDPSRDGVGNFSGGITELHRRFREGEVDVFEANGVDVLAVWQDLGNPDTLVYLLAYEDREARDAGWAAFNADPEWTRLRTTYFVPLTSEVRMMSATDYSPLK